ncbi:hypothetical protein P9112_008525 [Eukaryota sp. TZLM1-RC]
MSVDPSILKNHIFSDVQLGGVGFNSSKYLTKAAFIGGGKNFVFEFSRRYPFAENLLETTNSLFLDNLREEISSLSPDLWQSCFPISIQEIPDRSWYSLKFALKKLQRHLLKKFESKDFIVRLSTAKKENPAFANFLIDLKDSSSAVLINQIPQIYGLFLNDDQWTTAMRMRCYLWPCNLPNDLFCKCGAGLTLSHLFNCNRFISYRSTLHDAVRDQIHAMCNSYHIESFVEPLLRSLDINESVRDSEYGKRLADVVVPSFDDVMNVVDVVTVDVCKKNALKNAQSEVSPLDDSELYKRKKYANPLKELKHVRHVDYQICPFAISFQPSHISLSVTASKSYCFSVRTMPLADSDSDTDWNARVKILPVRPSSSSSLLHSPHNTSYARNSSQKNFNSKTDHCTRKNTQKPQLRSLRSVARSINNSVSRNLFSPAKIGKSQKSISTFNSPIDKIEITEKMKPLPLKTGKVHSQSCGKCRQPGHNVKTCPQVKQEQFKARAASADLK